MSKKKELKFELLPLGKREGKCEICGNNFPKYKVEMEDGTTLITCNKCLFKKIMKGENT